MKKLFPIFVVALLLLAGSLAFGSTTYSNIEDMTGWQTCSTCAGAGGKGPSTPHSMTHVSTPSLDGRSAQFNVGGSSPYANAIWWRNLGSHDTATNFVYDVYFYMKNPSASQALEFDINQKRAGKWYVFGTECVLAGTPHWNVYDAYNHRWVSTGISCTRPKAYTWNHLVIEFQRSSGGQHFVAVTLNGVKHYLNRTYSPKGASASTVDVAFQMDENGSATDYSTWVDKLKVTMW
jgi:hypothetical protein